MPLSGRICNLTGSFWYSTRVAWVGPVENEVVGHANPLVRDNVRLAGADADHLLFGAVPRRNDRTALVLSEEPRKHRGLHKPSGNSITADQGSRGGKAKGILGELAAEGIVIVGKHLNGSCST